MGSRDDYLVVVFQYPSVSSLDLTLVIKDWYSKIKTCLGGWAVCMGGMGVGGHDLYEVRGLKDKGGSNECFSYFPLGCDKTPVFR